MKAGIMSFIASGQHVGKQGGQATHDNDGELVYIGERTVANLGALLKETERAADTVNPVTMSVMLGESETEYKFPYGVTRIAPFPLTRPAVGVGAALFDRVTRRKGLTIGEALSAPPLSVFHPSVHKIVEAKKYEQDMADLSLFRERMGQMIEDELAALSDFEDFDETPAVHMIAGADGIFRPNT